MNFFAQNADEEEEGHDEDDDGESYNQDGSLVHGKTLRTDEFERRRHPKHEYQTQLIVNDPVQNGINAQLFNSHNQSRITKQGSHSMASQPVVPGSALN